MTSSQSQETLPEAKFIGSYGAVDKLPEDRPQVCFLGRSNSGKSTLISALIKNPRIVKTSSRPGSTQTINFYQYSSIYLVDLPGYGYAATGKNTRRLLSELIYRYINGNRQLAAGILLLDCVRVPRQEEFAIAKSFRQAGIPLLLCLTKADKLNQKEKALTLKRSREYESFFHLVLLVSAQRRAGLDPLINFIFSLGGPSL